MTVEQYIFMRVIISRGTWKETMHSVHLKRFWPKWCICSGHSEVV